MNKSHGSDRAHHRGRVTWARLGLQSACAVVFSLGLAAGGASAGHHEAGEKGGGHGHHGKGHHGKHFDQ